MPINHVVLAECLGKRPRMTVVSFFSSTAIGHGTREAASSNQMGHPSSCTISGAALMYPGSTVFIATPWAYVFSASVSATMLTAAFDMLV